MKSKLVLQTGQEFKGLSFGCDNQVIGEIFFNTSMVGYQDILSDPAYFGKIACMTYPLIGNYGLADEDYDFKNIFVKGYVVKENNDLPSNFRSTRTLSEAMEENKVSGLSDVDTREITKIIRDNGTMKAMITSEETPLDECLRLLNEYQEENPLPVVSCKKMWYSRTANPTHTVVVLDIGVKASFVKRLNEYGLNVIVVPYNTTVEQIKKLRPSGIIVSNGPGNPNDFEEVLTLVKSLKGKYPILALGNGAALVSLLYGATVNKMKYGHQGANHPIREVSTNKIEICSQNHFYEIKNLSEEVKVTHINVIDNDIEGFIDEKGKVIAVNYLLTTDIEMKKFIKLMK